MSHTKGRRPLIAREGRTNKMRTQAHIVHGFPCTGKPVNNHHTFLNAITKPRWKGHNNTVQNTQAQEATSKQKSGEEEESVLPVTFNRTSNGRSR